MQRTQFLPRTPHIQLLEGETRLVGLRVEVAQGVEQGGGAVAGVEDAPLGAGDGEEEVWEFGL